MNEAIIEDELKIDELPVIIDVISVAIEIN
jgi:hypothetical protein